MGVEAFLQGVQIVADVGVGLNLLRLAQVLDGLRKISFGNGSLAKGDKGLMAKAGGRQSAIKGKRGLLIVRVGMPIFAKEKPSVAIEGVFLDGVLKLGDGFLRIAKFHVNLGLGKLDAGLAFIAWRRVLALLKRVEIIAGFKVKTASEQLIQRFEQRLPIVGSFLAVERAQIGVQGSARDIFAEVKVSQQGKRAPFGLVLLEVGGNFQIGNGFSALAVRQKAVGLHQPKVGGFRLFGDKFVKESKGGLGLVSKKEAMGLAAAKIHAVRLEHSGHSIGGEAGFVFFIDEIGVAKESVALGIAAAKPNDGQERLDGLGKLAALDVDEGKRAMSAAKRGKFLDSLAQVFFSVVVVVDLIVKVAEKEGEGWVAVRLDLGEDDLDGLARLGTKEGKRLFIERAVLSGELGFDGFVDAVGSKKTAAKLRAVRIRISQGKGRGA